MKKAFTLIELLVVIAIIAILAAILFPVFAQAKAAAKKAVSISNQKQIALGIFLYGGDYDDMFPRNDDCQPNSALNTALNTLPFNPTGPGCTAAPFFYRMNHFSWQKWTMPYVKNVQLYFNPGRGINNTPVPSCPGGNWAACGQITGSYLFNTSLSGQLNTYNRSATASTRERNSWLGGSMTAVPNVAETMALMEDGNAQIGVVPVAFGADSSSSSVTIFPPAVRELWTFELGKQTAAYPGNQLAELDEQRVAFNGVIIGACDGHAKFYPYKKFLSLTPTAAEYGVSATPAFGWNSSIANPITRGFTGGTVGLAANPILTVNYPLWGLGQ